mmetsp:Transcript_21946/g.52645  ORF Transcript_21946/g.52645 Transcript_21946/m.52645 type:complete len:428 (-) Transcript_21946:120-1403(-)
MDERLDDEQVARRCGEVEARAAVVVRRVDVGLPFEQQMHPLELPLARQLAQLGRRLQVVHLERAAELDDLFRQVEVALADRVVERRAAPPVLAVDRRLGVEQPLHDDLVPDRAREVHAPPVVVIHRVHRAAAVDEQLQPVGVALPRQLTQLPRRRRLVVVEVAVRLEEEHRHLPVVLTHRVTQRRAAPPVGRVDLCAVVQQDVHQRAVARVRRQVQHGAHVVVAAVHLGAARDKEAELLEVALLRRLAQLARRRHFVPAKPAARGEDGARHLGVTPVHRHLERRPPHPVLLVGQRAMLQQGGRDACVPPQRGDVERRVPRVVHLVGVDGFLVRVAQRVDRRLVAHAHHREEVVDRAFHLVRDVRELHVLHQLGLRRLGVVEHALLDAEGVLRELLGEELPRLHVQEQARGALDRHQADRLAHAEEEG